MALPQKATAIRDYFIITEDSYNASHWKAWCQACFQAHVQSVLAADAAAVANGERHSVRSVAEARGTAYLFTPGMPISTRPSTLTAHVRNCERVGTKEFRDSLVRIREAEKLANIQARGRNALINITNAAAPQALPSASFAAAPGTGTFQFQPTLPGMPTFPGSAQQSSLAGAPSLGQLVHFSMPASARMARTNALRVPLPPDLQREFVSDLTRLFATVNIAWNVVGHPETHEFFAKWVPDAKLPARASMAGPLLTAEVKLATAHIRSEVQGRLATAQWDGWKNKARRSVITCVMNVQTKPYLVRSHDTFGKPKTGDFLWQLAQDDIRTMSDDFGVDLVGICTDDGPDGKRMRRLARESKPWLIVVLCWAHQNQLIIGDLIKNCPALKALLNRALDTIKWFLSHGAALGHLHDEQVTYLGAAVALTLLLPVITRWGAHYFSISRLLRLRQAIQLACIRHDAAWRAIRSRSDDEDAAGRAPKTDDVIRTIKDDEFWVELARAKEHLEPLAISSHVLQSDRTRLDHVAMMLRKIAWFYRAPHVDPDIAACVLASAEKRWKRADQEVFILAVTFNPYIRATQFNDAAISRNGLAEICKRLYERIMRQSFNTAIWSSFMRYLKAEGRFSRESMGLEYHRLAAIEEDRDVDLATIWEAACCRDARTVTDIADDALARLALRLVSVIANSGACERTFSGFGITHSRLRNRLAVKSTHDINLVRMHVEERHAAQGRIQPRKKRHLGLHLATGVSTGSSTESAGHASASASTAAPAPAPAADADTDADGSDETDTLASEAANLLASDTLDCDPTDLDAILEGIEVDDGRDDAAEEVYPAGSVRFTKITLADLFVYPTDPASSLPDALDLYWKGGIRNLELEGEVLEAAARGH